MNPLKRLVRTAIDTGLTARTVFDQGLLRLVVWSASDEEKAEWLLDVDEDEEDEEVSEEAVEQMERDAAYLTTGLITAVRAIHTAHAEGSNCSPHHDAAVSLLQGINHPVIAIRIIQHLLEIVAATVDDEDIQQMVATIVATELGEDKDDPRHHHH